MIVRECEVKVVTAVTVEARQPSPKSPWSKVEEGVSCVEALVEFVPIGIHGIFLLTIQDYGHRNKCSAISHMVRIWFGGVNDRQTNAHGAAKFAKITPHHYLLAGGGNDHLDNHSQ